MKYEDIKKRIIDSVPAVFIIAEFLHRKGYTIEIPGLKIRGKFESPEDNADSGDLFIIHKNGNKSRIEVKGISTQFTGVHDFPFPSIIVSAKKRIDSIGPTVTRWVILSDDKKHFASVSWENHKTWKAREVTPKNRDKKEWFYFSPLDTVKWYKIED